MNFPYFIDIGTFLPRDRSRVCRPIVFGSCGRLHHDKGYDLSLRALASAFSGRAHEFRYQLAGTGPETATLKKLSEELGIASQVEFLGWLDTEEIPQFYRDIEFFLHPARTEPYGVAVLEAMASGAIVIASNDTSAAVDRIVDGRNGFLHASNDVSHLARVIADATALSAQERDLLSVAARATAEAWPTVRGTKSLSQLLHKLSGPDTAVGYATTPEER